MFCELKAVFSHTEEGHRGMWMLVNFGVSSRAQELSLLQTGGTPFQKDTLLCVIKKLGR